MCRCVVSSHADVHGPNCSDQYYGGRDPVLEAAPECPSRGGGLAGRFHGLQLLCGSLPVACSQSLTWQVRGQHVQSRPMDVKLTQAWARQGGWLKAHQAPLSMSHGCVVVGWAESRSGAARCRAWTACQAACRAGRCCACLAARSEPCMHSLRGSRTARVMGRSCGFRLQLRTSRFLKLKLLNSTACSLTALLELLWLPSECWAVEPLPASLPSCDARGRDCRHHLPAQRSAVYCQQGNCWD